MKSFLNFFTEARTSQASDTAAKRGWTGDGHGNWFDKKGELENMWVDGIKLKKLDIPPQEWISHLRNGLMHGQMTHTCKCGERKKMLTFLINLKFF